MIYLVAALLGLLVGSFANVVIGRVPEGRSIVSPRSACPACGHEIRARDNIPVLSWVLLRGRCRDCSEPISVQYPLVELALAAIFGAIPAVVHDPWLWPATGWVGVLAVCLSVIDLRLCRLPDVLTIPGAVVLFALLALPAWAHGEWTRLGTAALGAVALTGLFAMLFVVSRGATGLGDVKLAAMVGGAAAWAGWPMLLVWLLFTFGVAAIVAGIGAVRSRSRGGTIQGYGVPFGPFMFAGLAATVLVGAPVYDWYVGAALGGA